MGCASSTAGNQPSKAKSSSGRKGVILDDVNRYYKLDKELGSGNFGQVRQAQHRLSKKMFAIKTIDRDKLRDEKTNNLDDTMLFKELDVLREVDHPNIIKFYETYADPKAYHLVMELSTGGELFDRIIAKKYYPEAEAQDLMRKIVGAINHCHENNIMHRDLKPENFLFENTRADAEVKIIDFGLSTKYKKNENVGEVLGTPFYVAPEVLNGQYDQKCDMWSLGVICYILLTGCPPFAGNPAKPDDNAPIFAAIKACKYNFNHPAFSKVSEDAKSFIRKLLVTDSKTRMSAAEALQHPWLAKNAPAHRLDRSSLENLQNFSHARQLKKEALTVIVKMLNDSEVSKLKEAFRAIDTDATGTITAAEITDAFRRAQINISREEIKAMLDRVDFDGNGQINYSEFLAATMDSSLYLSRDKLLAAFRHFDQENKNHITVDNLREAFVRAGKPVTEAQLSQMIREDDLNSDGKISFDEFESMMRTMGGVEKKPPRTNRV